MGRSNPSSQTSGSINSSTGEANDWNSHVGSVEDVGSSAGAESCVISLQDEDAWSRVDDVHLTGLCYYDGEYVTSDEIPAVFGDIRTEETLCERLEHCTGTFSVVIIRNDRVLAATGPAPASTGLFYSEWDGGYLADRYRWLEAQLPTQSYSQRIAVEMLLSGIIHGRDTLHPEVYQLQPGQILRIPRDETSSWLLTRYYAPEITGAVIVETDRMVDELEETMNTIFTRLKQAAADRPVLLALSGGYDSRLLAILLHKHGFEDVYAYGLNTQSHLDLSLSERVADRLGFEWVGFEYSHDDLFEMYESDFWHRLNDAFGNHGTAEPHATTGLTIKNILEHPDLPESGIKIAGDSPADAVGNYITESFISGETVPREEVVDILIRHYFGNKSIYSDTRRKIRNRILEFVDIEDTVPTSTAIGILSKWHWIFRGSRMRHAVFETAGFDVCDPYLEPEFFNFMTRLSPEEHYGRNFVERYVEKLNDEYLNGIEIDPERPPTFSPLKDAKTILRQRIVDTAAEDPIKAFKDWYLRFQLDYTEAYRDNLKYGFMSFDRFEREYTEREDYVYFYAKDELSRSRSRPDGSRVVPRELL